MLGDDFSPPLSYSSMFIFCILSFKEPIFFFFSCNLFLKVWLY